MGSISKPIHFLVVRGSWTVSERDRRASQSNCRHKLFYSIALYGSRDNDKSSLCKCHLLSIGRANCELQKPAKRRSKNDWTGEGEFSNSEEMKDDLKNEWRKFSISSCEQLLDKIPVRWEMLIDQGETPIKEH